MEQVKKMYQEAYEKYGKSKKTLFWPKGRQKERFELLTSHIVKENFSLLDFGCGFGDLRKYLLEQFKTFNYLGVDIVDEFINEAKKESDDFYKITDVSDVDGKFDNICICGTLNISYFDDIEKHKEEVRRILKTLFDKNLNDNGVLSVDFMHDEVDYQSEHAFHVNVVKIYNFLSKNLSNRIIMNKSVFPYEVTFTVFKNTNKSQNTLFQLCNT